MSNFASPPAELEVYLRLIMQDFATRLLVHPGNGVTHDRREVSFDAECEQVANGMRKFFS